MVITHIIILISIFIIGIYIGTLHTTIKYKYKNKSNSIEDIKRHICKSLDNADKFNHKIIFRTPECKAYKNYHLHIAKTENNKEIIIVDLNK